MVREKTEIFNQEDDLFTELETVVLLSLQAIYDALGWLGVAVLLIFENATGITPSEIILSLAGWMLIAERQLSPAWIFLGGFYAAIGSTLGASITYWAARLGGRPLVDKFIRRVRMDPVRVQRSERQFQRWGIALVFVGRVMPAVRTFINIPAGLGRMRFLHFTAATFCGSYIWCTLLIGAGYVLGHEWSLISTYIERSLPYLLGGGILVLALYFWFTRLRFARRKYQSS